jgi:hypothetical protein
MLPSYGRRLQTDLFWFLFLLPSFISNGFIIEYQQTFLSYGNGTTLKEFVPGANREPPSY